MICEVLPSEALAMYHAKPEMQVYFVIIQCTVYLRTLTNIWCLHFFRIASPHLVVFI